MVAALGRVVNADTPIWLNSSNLVPYYGPRRSVDRDSYADKKAGLVCPAFFRPFHLSSGEVLVVGGGHRPRRVTSPARCLPVLSGLHPKRTLRLPPGWLRPTQPPATRRIHDRPETFAAGGPHPMRPSRSEAVRF